MRARPSGSISNHSGASGVPEGGRQSGAAAALHTLTMPPLPLAERIKGALVQIENAENEQQRGSRLVQLWRLLKEYDAAKAQPGYSHPSSKLLAHACLELGSFWVEDRLKADLVEELLIEGLSQNEKGPKLRAWRAKGAANLAEHHIRIGKVELALRECEWGLRDWNRLDADCAYTGLLLQVYGSALRHAGNKQLCWRQYEASERFFREYRLRVPGRRSDILYVEALSACAENGLAIGRLSPRDFLEMKRRAYVFLSNEFGDEDSESVNVRLEFVRAHILNRNYSTAFYHCQAMRDVVDRVLERGMFDGDESGFLQLVSDCAEFKARILVWCGIGQWLDGLEALGRDFLERAGKCCLEAGDHTGELIRATVAIARADFKAEVRRNRSRYLGYDAMKLDASYARLGKISEQVAAAISKA